MASAPTSCDFAPFIVLIPARLASTRLPDKPLADIAGEPMIVRVARQASRSAAARVVVATDSVAVAEAVRRGGYEVVMTREDHRSGTERLAEAAAHLGVPDEAIVVNMQGDEPELPPALLDDVARCLSQDEHCVMATAAHEIDQVQDWFNPNVVKVVLDASDRALYFSRAPIPFHRDGLGAGGGPGAAGPGAAGPDATGPGAAGPGAAGGAAGEHRAPDPAAARLALAAARPLRHIGLYAYRGHFLKAYTQMAKTALEDIEALEQLRVLYHGFPIKVLVTAQAPGAGIDTPQDLEAARRRFASRAPASHAGLPPA